MHFKVLGNATVNARHLSDLQLITAGRMHALAVALADHSAEEDSVLEMSFSAAVLQLHTVYERHEDP